MTLTPDERRRFIEYLEKLNRNLLDIISEIKNRGPGAEETTRLLTTEAAAARLIAAKLKKLAGATVAD